MHTHHARQKANHTHLKTALLHRLAALQACFFLFFFLPTAINGLTTTHSPRPPNPPERTSIKQTCGYISLPFSDGLFHNKAFGNPPAFRQTPRQTQEESTR